MSYTLRLRRISLTSVVVPLERIFARSSHRIMASGTPNIRCPRSGRVLTPLSLDYWRVRRTLKTLLSSESEDEVCVSSTPTSRYKIKTVSRTSWDDHNSCGGERTKSNVRGNGKENREMEISATRVESPDSGNVPRPSRSTSNRHTNLHTLKDKLSTMNLSSERWADRQLTEAFSTVGSSRLSRGFENEQRTPQGTNVLSELPTTDLSCLSKPGPGRHKKTTFSRIQFAGNTEDASESDSFDDERFDAASTESAASNEPHTGASASDMSLSIIHTPRQRAAQMRIDSSSSSGDEEPEGGTTSSDNRVAEACEAIATRLAVVTLGKGSLSATSDHEVNAAENGFSHDVIELSSDDDLSRTATAATPHDTRAAPASRKPTNISAEYQNPSVSPATPARFRSPSEIATRKRVAVTEPRKGTSKTTHRKPPPMTEKPTKTKSLKARRELNSDDESFDELLDKLKNRRFQADGCDKTQVDLNNTGARWESSNNDDRRFLLSLSEKAPIEGCHPDALYYRTRNFTTIRDELTDRLYELFHRTVFQSRFVDGVSVRWNVRLLSTAGLCLCKKHPDDRKFANIELSTKVVDRADRLRDTLVHEMCHAGAWIIHGYNGGHGPLFKFWGQRAAELLGLEVTTCHSYTIEKKFTYICEGCGHAIGRHSKSLDTQQYVCAHCKGRFQLAGNRDHRS